MVLEIYTAATMGEAEMMQSLHDADEDGYTLLHKCASEGPAHHLQALLRLYVAILYAHMGYVQANIVLVVD